MMMTMAAAVVLEARADAAFVLTPSRPRRLEIPAAKPMESEPSSAGFGSFALMSSAAVLALAVRHSSRVQMRAGSPKMWGNFDSQSRRQWRGHWSNPDPKSHEPETRCLYDVPYWQVDSSSGFRILKKRMAEYRRAGKKLFWELRVERSTGNYHGRMEKGGWLCKMKKTGLNCVIPSGHFPKGSLQPGQIVMAECIACPNARVNALHGERSPSHWPNLEPLPQLAKPMFSYNNWLTNQANIAKAKELKAGEIIEAAEVLAVTRRGLIMGVGGGARGMLHHTDISRKAKDEYMAGQLFPVGTVMPVYMVNANPRDGRIVVATNVFEDDDHVGWMYLFPERLLALDKAKQAVAEFHQKRDDFIMSMEEVDPEEGPELLYGPTSRAGFDLHLPKPPRHNWWVANSTWRIRK